MATQELSIELKAHLNKGDIRVIETELKRLGSEKGIALTANVADLKNKLTQAQALLKTYQKQGGGVSTITLTANVTSLQKQVAIANRALNNFVATGETTKSRLGGIMNSIKTGFLSTFGVFSIAGALASSIRGFFRFLSSSIDVAISFESAFAGIKKTIDATDVQFKALSDTLKKLSTEIPVTFEELSKIGEIGGQLGVGIDDIDEFVESVARISASTNLTSEEAATNFAQIANLTKTPISQIEKMADSVVELGNKSTATESGILEMSNRIAGAGTTAGFTTDQIFALATTLSSAGIEAEAGGSAMQKVLLKIHKAVIAGGEGLADFAKATGMSSEEFKQSWGVDAGKTFAMFIDGLKKYGDQGILEIEGLLGVEVRQTRSMLALTQAQMSYNDSLKIAAGAEGALAQESEKRFGTNASQLQMLNNEITLQKELIGNGLLPVKKAWYGMILGLTTAVSKFVNKSGDLAKSMKDVGQNMKAFLIIFGTAAVAGLMALLGPIGRIIAGLTAIAVVSVKTVSAFKNMQYEIRLFRDGIKDANGNLTEYGKKLELGKQELYNYAEGQKRANSALQAYNNIKVDNSRNRAQREANRQAAIAEAKAHIAATEALLAKETMAAKVAGMGTSFGFQGGETPLQTVSKKNLSELLKRKAELAKIEKDIYTAPTGGGGSVAGTKEETDGIKKETEAMKELREEMEAYGKETKKLREEKKKKTEDTVKSMFDRIGDAIKDANGNLEDFQKELQGIVDEIKDLNEEIKELESSTQADIAERYVEAGNELEELNKKLLEQQDKLSESKDAVTELGEEIQQVADDVDTTPFRIILDQQIEDDNEKIQDKIDKELKNQSEIQQSINDILAQKLELEQEIALASSETTDTERARAELLDSENVVERLIRERDEKTALIEIEKNKLNLQKTALQNSIDKEKEFIDVLTERKNVLTGMFDYLETAQDRYLQQLDQTILKWKEIIDAGNTVSFPALKNVSKGSTSSSTATDNSVLNLSLYLQDIGFKGPTSVKDLEDKFGRAWVVELADKLAKKIALDKKTGG